MRHTSRAGRSSLAPATPRAVAVSAAQAHTEPTTITPAKDATAVTLTFSEPINLRFSTFQVLRVPTGKTPADAAKLALRLKADAPELANLNATGGMVARLTLPLKARLPAGPYVIAWRLLSDDGHPVTGHSSFALK